MNPVAFQEANTTFGPPVGMDESQVAPIPAFVGVIAGGNLDGALLTVVAWKPTEEELKELNAGGSAFLSTINGLPPHYITTSFLDAVNI